MQKKWRWIILSVCAAIVLAVAAFLLWLFVPRQIDMKTQGLLIHGDGTTEVTDITITGNWKHVFFDEAKRKFSGQIRVDGIPWFTGENLGDNHVSFTEDLWDTELLMGSEFVHEVGDTGMTTVGHAWILTDNAMDSFIMIATENGASTVTWVIVPAQSIEDAIALRNAWKLPETDFNWE